MVSGSLHVSNWLVSPYSKSFVSQSGWWCPALCMSPIHLSPLTAIHLSPSLAGGVRLSRMSPNSFISPYLAMHLSPILAGGVRLFGCLKFICLPYNDSFGLPVLLVVYGFPDVSNSFVSPYKQFICLPVWLVVSGSSDVSNSFVSLIAIHLSPSLAGGVRLSGCLHLTFHLSPSLAGGVRLSGCLQFICLPL